MNQICEANTEVLKQLIELIHCCENQYSQKNGSIASIGEHVRHILDHYRALKNGNDANCINYNLRNRNSREESDSSIALENTHTLMRWLASLDEINRSIEVISEISINQTTHHQLTSTIERELLYLINHSIHHLAYAALAAAALGIEVPSHIGLAPGTASYLREQKEAC